MLKSTVAILLFAGAVATAADRPNVLFIAVDDLRPELGCYGRDHIHSPNIDALSETATLFERAYTMVPTCGASRASMMSGVRPARDRFTSYLAWADKEAPDAVTMNTHFRRNGYYTVSLGKVFHHPQDSSEGWSEPAWRPKAPTYKSPGSLEAEEANKNKRNGKGRRPAVESADVGDNAYKDGRVARRAIRDLKRLKERGEPFFLAVGFFKPHLPFVAPKKYWDLYDRSEIHLPATYHRPENAPDVAIHSSGELRSYAGIPPEGPVTDEQALELIHGYYACVSYTDALIGKVLKALDANGLTDDTIVVLWTDHGWNLGEHTMWCKHCCFETSMQIPLLVRAPGVKGNQRTMGLTESIDVYPSLCELAGLSLPEHLQGRSFAPLLQNPKMEWKSAAVGRFKTGDTIRTEQYRFTEFTSNRGQAAARMLYDHSVDAAEDKNVSEAPSQAATVHAHTHQLHELMGRPYAKAAR